jgi:uncharacterized membrane protein SirB2
MPHDEIKRGVCRGVIGRQVYSLVCKLPGLNESYKNQKGQGMLVMEVVKRVHVACVLLSGGGFFVRGILMMQESVLQQARVMKIAPHVVDSLLLMSAIALASQWGWAALQLPWLVTKIVALLLYIGLGMLALRRGRTKTVRVSAWLAAMAVFIYIVAVAVTKNPLLDL